MRLRPLLIAGAITLLAGCSGNPVPAEPDDATAPQAQETSAPTTDAPSEAQTPSAVPAAETTAAPTDDPADEAWSAPAECTGLQLEPGATLDGADLGDCVATALRSYGSGREHIVSQDLSGHADFTYDPDLNLQGTMTTPEGDMTLTLLGDDVWIDQGDGAVKGDASSSDPQAQLVATVGALYRVFSSPEMTVDLISASPEWVVGDVPETRELPNGQSVEAHRIDAVAAFSWHEIQVVDYSVWFTSDFTPVAVEGTTSMMGTTGTLLQEFYDLGADITITPPA